MSLLKLLELPLQVLDEGLVRGVLDELCLFLGLRVDSLHLGGLAASFFRLRLRGDRRIDLYWSLCFLPWLDDATQQGGSE